MANYDSNDTDLARRLVERRLSGPGMLDRRALLRGRVQHEVSPRTEALTGRLYRRMMTAMTSSHGGPLPWPRGRAGVEPVTADHDAISHAAHGFDHAPVTSPRVMNIAASGDADRGASPQDQLLNRLVSRSGAPGVVRSREFNASHALSDVGVSTTAQAGARLLARYAATPMGRTPPVTTAPELRPARSSARLSNASLHAHAQPAASDATPIEDVGFHAEAQLTASAAMPPVSSSPDRASGNVVSHKAGSLLPVTGVRPAPVSPAAPVQRVAMGRGVGASPVSSATNNAAFAAAEFVTGASSPDGRVSANLVMRKHASGMSASPTLTASVTPVVGANAEAAKVTYPHVPLQPTPAHAIFRSAMNAPPAADAHGASANRTVAAQPGSVPSVVGTHLAVPMRLSRDRNGSDIIPRRHEGHAVSGDAAPSSKNAGIRAPFVGTTDRGGVPIAGGPAATMVQRQPGPASGDTALVWRKPDTGHTARSSAAGEQHVGAGISGFIARRPAPQASGSDESAPAPAAQPAAVPPVDIDWIVEQVGRRLAKRLAIERERTGARQWR